MLKRSQSGYFCIEENTMIHAAKSDDREFKVEHQPSFSLRDHKTEFSSSNFLKSEKPDLSKGNYEKIFKHRTMNKMNINKHDEWSLDFLCDYIISNHHAYLKKSILQILSNLKKLSREKGSVNGSYRMKLKKLFDDIEIHMNKEEKLLFPYIKKLVNMDKRNEEYEIPPFGSVSDLIKVIEKEHRDEGKELGRLSRIWKENNSSMNHSEPEFATAEMLEAMISDFIYHIHLENNILFPKSIILEKKLKRITKLNKSKIKK